MAGIIPTIPFPRAVGVTGPRVRRAVTQDTKDVITVDLITPYRTSVTPTQWLHLATPAVLSSSQAATFIHVVMSTTGSHSKPAVLTVVQERGRG